MAGGSRPTSDDSTCDKRKPWSGTHAYSLHGLGHHNLATGMQAMKRHTADQRIWHTPMAEPNMPNQ